jgi:hypothetical protein
MFTSDVSDSIPDRKLSVYSFAFPDPEKSKIANVVADACKENKVRKYNPMYSIFLLLYRVNKVCVKRLHKKIRKIFYEQVVG